MPGYGIALNKRRNRRSFGSLFLQNVQAAQNIKYG